MELKRDIEEAVRIKAEILAEFIDYDQSKLEKIKGYWNIFSFFKNANYTRLMLVTIMLGIFNSTTGIQALNPYVSLTFKEVTKNLKCDDDKLGLNLDTNLEKTIF